MSEKEIDALIAEMTLAEKIGQLCQVQPHGRDIAEAIAAGAVGSVINAVGDDAYFFQSVAVEQSRLKIPLLIGRDVIHGFNTIFPIPLGQAASFDPDQVEAAAALSAIEAGIAGVNWTFSPMVDIGRDPRWGRVAEGFGEDPYLTSRMGEAMIGGYQSQSVAACAKHFVGYGAAEGGRDYSEAAIPPRQMHDFYLPPFEVASKAGVLSVMSAFNDIDGVPATGNKQLLTDTLKKGWGFDGLVVSDWDSVIEMIPHGFAADEADAAEKALGAGVDMEMASRSFANHLPELIESGRIDIRTVDAAVRRVLRVKHKLGLFNQPYGPKRDAPRRDAMLHAARKLARDACVLVKNDSVLPLGFAHRHIAVVGPLADAADNHLGCWVFDADRGLTRTPLAGLRERLGDTRVSYEPGLPSARSTDQSGIAAAVDVARNADIVIACLGEDAGLSGEAHCRAHLGLPGAQQDLLKRLHETGKPVVSVVFSGRPLVLDPVLKHSDAVLLAWHLGTMAGVAVTDILFGEAPRGRLPMSFPHSEGQIPVYYNHKNTGRPPPPGKRVVPSGTPLDPSGFFATYLDEDHKALLPFGFGLSYTSFSYGPVVLSREKVASSGRITASAVVTNTGGRSGDELVQLYVRGHAGSVTRPVRELKGFRRVALVPGESRKVSFELSVADLAFTGYDMSRKVELGRYSLWICPDSASGSPAEFTVTE